MASSRSSTSSERGDGPRRLFLIDGTALAYRSHFAFATSSRGGLSTRDGRPTSAIYGFITTLLALIEREQPDAMAISFDGARGDLLRTRVYAEYKSTRDKMPDELVEQMPVIEQVVAAYGIPVVRSEEHEADDVIGTLAVRGRDAGMEVMIVTGDKDFMQLVGDHIHLWNLRAATTAPQIIGPDEVEAKFGVEPERMIDLLALMGDSSDNIPGVPRVGQKTAAELLAEFGSLDEVLERSEEVGKPSIRKALAEHREQAELSRELVTIHTDVDVAVEVDAIPPPTPDRDALEALFRELEFDSLLRRLPEPEAPPLDQDYRVVRTADQLDELLAGLRASGGFAFHAELSDPRDVRHADLVGMSLSWQDGVAWYVPFNQRESLFDAGAPLDRLRPLLEDPDLPKTVHDAKRELGALRHAAGIAVRGIDFDTMLAAYLESPGIGQHDLDTLTLRHFGYKKTPAREVVGSGKKQKTFDQIDVEVVGRFAAEDADFAWRMRHVLEPLLGDAELVPVFEDIELPLVPVLLGMESEGIAIDVEQLHALSRDMQARIDDIEQRIHERAGEPFNLNSPQQIGKVLFESLEVHRAAGISRPGKTRTGQWKTDAAILDKLAPHHEVPALLLEYRRISKLKGTYVDTLPLLVDPATGRVHTTFNQAIAATGRLSSDNPNLQNIPIRTEEGREVRRAFVSRGKGWVLLSADYSQIELRILAHMSGDPTLIESFRRQEDIHARTAALVHGIMPELVTAELRTQAKAINYGLMYGMGPSRLARDTGMKPPEAKRFINAYFKALPKVKEYLDATLDAARHERQVRTLFGRRRPLPDIDAQSPMQRVAAENMAVNTPIQGTAADIIKMAMLEVDRRLRAEALEARMILQVHDELVLDVPEKELARVELLLREAMAGAAELKVPLEVSMGHGRSWLDAH